MLLLITFSEDKGWTITGQYEDIQWASIKQDLCQAKLSETLYTMMMTLHGHRIKTIDTNDPRQTAKQIRDILCDGSKKILIDRANDYALRLEYKANVLTVISTSINGK